MSQDNAVIADSATAPVVLEQSATPEAQQTPIQKAVSSGDMPEYNRLMRAEERGNNGTEATPEPQPAEGTQKPGESAKPNQASDTAEEGADPQKPSDPAPEGNRKPPSGEQMRRLRQENAALKRQLEAKAEPAATQQPPKPVEQAAPSTADPEPEIENYSAEDLGKFFRDQKAWMKRETERQVEAGFKTRDTQAAEKAAQEAGEKRHTELTQTQAKLDGEFKDWTTAVIGTKEQPGLIAVMDPEIVSWASGKGEVAFRGLYQIAKADVETQEDFLAMPKDEQVAEVLRLGKQQASAKAQPPSAIRLTPSKPPAEARGSVTGASDPIRAAVERNDPAAYYKLANARDRREREGG